MRVNRRVLIGAGGAAALAAAGAGAWMFRKSGGGTPDSVAVLPFANLSGDPAQAYFSDGMAEELRNALARIPGLKVVARTSSEMLRDSDAKAAANKLGVAAILTGSVRRSPSTIRVNAQLIDGADGIERWSQSFDRPAGDVLKIQTSIAENVAQQLRSQFAGSNHTALTVGGTRNAEAQDLILQVAEANDDEAGFRHGLALANRAISLDPNYAIAYAVKARMTVLLGAFYAHSAAENRALMTQAKGIARKAIALDPNLPEAHRVLALISRNQLDMGGSQSELAKANALPGSPAALQGAFADALADNLQFDRASQVVQSAIASDPLNMELQASMGSHLISARRYDQAFPIFERYLREYPDRIGPRYLYATALLFAGRNADAQRQFQLLPADDYHRLIGLAMISEHAGDHGTAVKLMNRIRARFGSAANYQYAQFAAQSGDLEGGIAALDAAWKERDPGMPKIKVDRFLDPLRKDPRFAAIVAKMNFPAS